MTLTRSGIPTTYRETAFRSRLEARWAAFFDLVGWSWVYEPFDATGWIPDFLIRGKRAFLVEIGACIDEEQYREKATKPLHFTELPTLILGVAPSINGPEWWQAGLLVNEFRKHPEAAPASWTACAAHGLTVIGDTVQLPCADASIGHIPDLDGLWSKAGNTVQWRP